MDVHRPGKCKSIFDMNIFIEGRVGQCSKSVWFLGSDEVVILTESR